MKSAPNAFLSSLTGHFSFQLLARCLSNASHVVGRRVARRRLRLCGRNGARREAGDGPGASHVWARHVPKK